MKLKANVKRHTRSPGLRLLGLFLVAAWLVLGALLASPVEAQLFPRGETLEELEEEAERLAREQEAIEERQRALAEREEENRERWRAFQRTLRQTERQIPREARRGESATLRNELNDDGRAYEVGTIMLALGEWRSAEQYITSMQSRLRHEAAVVRGGLDVLEVRTEMLRRFGDGASPSRIERTVEQFNEMLEQRLEATQRRGDRRQRERRHESLRAWMSEFPRYLSQRDAMIEAIEEDTFDGERIWNLANLLADSLYMHAEARSWLAVLIEHCEDHWVVRSGLAHAGLAKILARQGFLDRAQSLARGLEGRCERFFDRIADEAQALQRRVQEAREEGRGLTLSPMERWLLQSASNQRRQQRRSQVRNQIRELGEAVESISEEYRDE